MARYGVCAPISYAAFVFSIAANTRLTPTPANTIRATIPAPHSLSGIEARSGDSGVPRPQATVVTVTAPISSRLTLGIRAVEDAGAVEALRYAAYVKTAANTTRSAKPPQRRTIIGSGAGWPGSAFVSTVTVAMKAV